MVKITTQRHCLQHAAIPLLTDCNTRTLTLPAFCLLLLFTAELLPPNDGDIMDWMAEAMVQVRSFLSTCHFDGQADTLGRHSCWKKYAGKETGASKATAIVGRKGRGSFVRPAYWARVAAA